MATNTRTKRTATPSAPTGASPTVSPLITATLAACRDLLVHEETVGGKQALVPHVPSHEQLAKLDPLMAQEERSRVNPAATRDQRLDSPRRLGWRGVSLTAPLAWEQWERRIRADECVDVASDWRSLRLDRRDGSLYRVGGQGRPATRHALGQLHEVLGGAWSGSRSTLLSAPAYVAAQALLVSAVRTERGAEDGVVVRTGLWLDQRVVRAVVTPRHALTLLDDVTLLAVLRKEVPITAEVAVDRAPLGCETRGWARARFDEHTDLVQHWRNSETGEGRLSMRGGVRIRALDAHVVTPYGTTARMVEVASANAASERNHTLPTLGTESLALAHPRARITVGALLTAEQRKVIAEDRMADSYRQATEDARKLAAAWQVALSAYPTGFHAGDTASSAEEVAEVLLDVAEEEVGIGNDREALRRVLVNDERLQQLPRFSAAHVAAAYAVLASGPVVTVEKQEDGTEVETRTDRTWEEAARLQACAGRWVLAGWSSKEHRKLRGEE